MTASMILLATVALATVGVVFAAWLWGDARRDVAALRGFGNGRLTMARARARQAGFAFAFTVLVAFKASVLAWLMVPIVGQLDGRMRWEVYAILGGMFVTSLLVCTDGWLTKREMGAVNRRIRAALDSEGRL